MAFQSILFQNTDTYLKDGEIEEIAPEFFPDLNLDQIIDTIILKKEVYRLRPFFFTKLDNVPAIEYRQEIMSDLENPILYAIIETFAGRIRKMYDILSNAETSTFKYEKERLFLDAARKYVKAVLKLKTRLSKVDLKSFGFLEFQKFLISYTNSSEFSSFSTETKDLIGKLNSVSYSIHIKDLRIEVRPNIDECDYSEEVENTFKIFEQEPVKDYRITFEADKGINHVQASILEGVAQLYPDVFQHLVDFSKQNKDFLNKAITRFDREVQFYISYLDYISGLKAIGLNFCHPEITTSKNELYNFEGFDLALANKLKGQNSTIVCNDLQLSDQERVIVVTGPNQGGKTTYARTIGQLHYLANLGCPVPGKKAKLFLFDQLFTHFEKEEIVEDHRSKLETDLLKIHQILDRSTENSILIMNEILSSTTLKDAIFLSKKIMAKICQLDALCVWVTFIDELAVLNNKTVSLVGTVVPENPAIRTFKIIKKETTGIAYALSIAKKYRVTYKDIKERITK